MQEFPTGYLSLDDFKRNYLKYFPSNDFVRFAQYLFRMIDRNHDGLIDFSDLIFVTNLAIHGNLFEKIDWLFLMYDLDNDGFISKKDLADILDVRFCYLLFCFFFNLNLQIDGLY